MSFYLFFRKKINKKQTKELVFISSFILMIKTKLKLKVERL